LLNLSKSEWEDLSEELYQQLFRRSAVKRTKFEGLKRNLRFVTSS
jgi:epoxyqueuosine reductase